MTAVDGYTHITSLARSHARSHAEDVGDIVHHRAPRRVAAPSRPHQSVTRAALVDDRSRMALRKVGETPLERARRVAINEAEKLEAQRDAEARAAFEATFKRAGKYPARLPPVGQRLGRPDDEASERRPPEALAREVLENIGEDGDGAAGDEARRTTSGFGAGTTDPVRSTANGAGVGGGAAGKESAFTVVSRDGEDKRVHRGGERVKFRVKRKSDDEVVASGTGKDWNDGTYGCAYAVDARGEYEVEVTMNDVSILGSPFEVFYSAPLDGPLVARGRAGVGRRLPSGEKAPLGVCRDFLVGKCDRVICKFKHDAPPPPPPPPSGEVVDVPPPPVVTEELRRTVHVSNYPLGLTMDQVKQVFSFCGNIVDAREGGAGKNFAFLEFSTDKEALAALALNGMNVGGRNIRAELAKTPKLLNPRSFTPPVVPAAPAAQSERAKAAQSEAAARAAAISARLSAKGAQGDDVRYKPY